MHQWVGNCALTLTRDARQARQPVLVRVMVVFFGLSGAGLYISLAEFAMLHSGHNSDAIRVDDISNVQLCVMKVAKLLCERADRQYL